MGRRGRCVRRNLAARRRGGLSTCLKRSSQIASRSLCFRALRGAFVRARSGRFPMDVKNGPRIFKIRLETGPAGVNSARPPLPGLSIRVNRSIQMLNKG